MDADRYGRQAEAFISALDREHYLHFSGQKASFEVEAIFDQHAELFSLDAVQALREDFAAAADRGPDGRRQAAYRLHFAVDGYLGQAVKAEAAELAATEAQLEVELDGNPIAYRSASVAQANEPSSERRAELERARNELLSERLTRFTGRHSSAASG